MKRTSRPAPSTGTKFLLEIGTEELPWQVIEPSLAQLEQSLGMLLTTYRVAYEQIRTVGAPRRLTVLADGVALKQTSVHQELLGPPKNRSYDEDGNLTKMAEGFARSHGVPLEKLGVKKTRKGEYLCVIKEEKGRNTNSILRESLTDLILRMSFPKSMKWNDTGLRFARPIRWILAMNGSTVLKVKVAGIISGNRTWGHRFSSRRSQTQGGIVMKSPEAYLTTLERYGVIVDHHMRRAHLEARLASLARVAKGKIYQENYEELLEQATFSVEYPGGILGQFHHQYLNLPQEVLIAAMKEHQGFFSLVGKDGKLLPKFLAPVNMKLPDKDMGIIQKGNERVLSARLADAQFYFQEDRKVKLAERVELLKGVTFHQKLGSLYEKTERMVKLIAMLADQCGLGNIKEACRRAAFLSKADLTSGMVGEFPLLQGMMGREYARHDGESESICLGVGEHYRPRYPEDDIPESSVGMLLSLADRLDTLTAFFRAGILPSGSEDPLGLRRQAFGMVRLLVEGKLDVDLLALIQSHVYDAMNVALEVSGKDQGKGTSNGSSLKEFIFERLRYYGRIIHGFRDDVMEAVLSGCLPNQCRILDLFLRMQAVQSVTSQEAFDPLMIGYKRAHRLVEKEGWMVDSIDTELFEHESERTLSAMVKTAEQTVASTLVNRDYPLVLQTLINLKPSIDEFFDSVLVNAPEPAIRANRLSLLYQVDRLFGSVADFSHIQVQGR